MQMGTDVELRKTIRPNGDSNFVEGVSNTIQTV